MSELRQNQSSSTVQVELFSAGFPQLFASNSRAQHECIEVKCNQMFM